MDISGSLGEIDKVCRTQLCESSVDGIEEIVNRDIVRGLYPLPFEHSPESLRNIEMMGIRRQEEKIQSSFLPYEHPFLDQAAPTITPSTNATRQKSSGRVPNLST